MALFEYDVLMSKIKDGVETIVYPFTKAKNVLGLSDEIASKVSNKNYIIDGGFQVWIDGTNVSPSSLKYGHTLWRNFGHNNTYTQGYDDNLGYTMKVSTSADSQTVRCMHYLDTKTILPQLKGKTMTLSFWVKRHTEGAKGYMAFSNNSIFVDTAPVGEWTKFTKTGVLNYVEGSAGTYDNCVCFLTASATPWNTGDGIEIAQVKFEIGDVATDFEPERLEDVVKNTSYFYRGIPRTHYRCQYCTSSYLTFYFDFDTMRAVPTNNVADLLSTTSSAISPLTSGAGETGFEFTGASGNSGSLTLTARKDNHGLTDGVLNMNYTGNILLDARVYN